MKRSNIAHFRSRTFLILWSPSQSPACEIRSINSVNPVWPLVHRPAPHLPADNHAEPLQRLRQPVRPDAPTAGRPRWWAGGTTVVDLLRIGYWHLVDEFGKCSSPWRLQSKLDLSSGNPMWPLHNQCAVRRRHPTATSLRVKKFWKTFNLNVTPEFWEVNCHPPSREKMKVIVGVLTIGSAPRCAAQNECTEF